MTKVGSRGRRAAARRPPAAPLSNFSAASAALESASSDLDSALAMIALARRSLLAAQVRLKAILRDSTDPTEQADASAEVLGVERDLQLLESRRGVLVGNVARLRPPSEPDIVEAQRLAGLLAQVLAANAMVSAIAGLTADLVRLTEKLIA